MAKEPLSDNSSKEAKIAEAEAAVAEAETETAATPPLPTENEDEVLSAASQDLNTDDQIPAPSKPAGSKKKKVIRSLIILLILVLAGGAIWYFFFAKEASAPAPSDAAKAEITPTNNYIPETVAYAFRTSGNDPFSLYWRPAAGGERSEAQKLLRDEYPSYVDTQGQSVAFGVGDQTIYASTDSGKHYRKVFEVEAGETISSLRLSTDGQEVAANILSEDQKSSTVKGISLGGDNVHDLFKHKQPNIFIEAWNRAKNKIAYTGYSCFRCDGATATFYIQDLTTHDDKKIFTPTNGKSVQNFAVSDDVTTAVAVQVSEYKSIPVEGIPGYLVGAPYDVQVISLENGKATTLTTIGTKGEKNANGTYRYRSLEVGFLAGTATPYYTDENRIMVAGQTEPLFTSDKLLFSVAFVSQTAVYAEIGTEQSTDPTFIYYDAKDKKSTTIYQGDENTVLFGVTTR